MVKQKDNNKQSGLIFRNFLKQYRFVVIDETNLQERATFRLSRFIIFISLLISIGITAYIFVFTEVREKIPGYTDETLSEKIYNLEKFADSLQQVSNVQQHYLSNIRGILSGELIEDSITKIADEGRDYSHLRLTPSIEDSLLRLEIENRNTFDLQEQKDEYDKKSYYNLSFFPPVNGIITNKYNEAIKHYGVDLVCKKDEVVKSTLDGTVIFAEWTVETGYVITIQHSQNIISIYKHNAALLRNMGDHVKAGEAIAIIGNTGEYTSGSHLHFEIWHNGTPLNPKEILNFD